MMCYIKKTKTKIIIHCSFLFLFSFFFLLKMFENNDSSSSDNDESLSKQVLPTIEDYNEPIDLNKIPTTGEEYLRQVRYEN